MFNDIAALISLALTVPTVMFAVAVLCIWGKEALRVFKAGPSNPMEWLIIGVVIAFLGSVVNNLYWGFAWSHTYLSGQELDPTIAHMGVVFNIFFRQVCGILAAYCHLKSYTELKKDSNLNANLWISSSIVGVVYVMLLSLFKR